MNARSPDHAPERLAWLVIANAARARVFERDDANGAIREIDDLVHPASRAKEAALGTHPPGRVRKGVASTAFEPHTEPHARERARFAHELARKLEDAALARRMPDLVLIASNPFLGKLKAALGPAAGAILKASVVGDLTLLQGAELEHRVSQLLGERADAKLPNRQHE